MSEILFTRERAVALKEAYRKAVKHQNDVFIFEGREYVKDYAKYLLQFLETRLGKF